MGADWFKLSYVMSLKRHAISRAQTAHGVHFLTTVLVVMPLPVVMLKK